MGAEIKDEFSNMPISRQRKYYLRKRKQGKCTKCGKPAEDGSLCTEHLVGMREYRRQKFGLKRRYYKSLSYKLASRLPLDAIVPAQPANIPVNGAEGPKELLVDSRTRDVKERVDTVLSRLAPDFEETQAIDGHFNSGEFLKCWVLMNLYSIPSPRLFCEQLPFNVLWLWFIGREIKPGELHLDVATFERSYERLLRSDVAREFFAAFFAPATTQAELAAC